MLSSHLTARVRMDVFIIGVHLKFNLMEPGLVRRKKTGPRNHMWAVISPRSKVCLLLHRTRGRNAPYTLMTVIIVFAETCEGVTTFQPATYRIRLDRLSRPRLRIKPEKSDVPFLSETACEDYPTSYRTQLSQQILLYYLGFSLNHKLDWMYNRA